MPTAKSLFLERISSLNRSAQIEAVTNKPLTEKAHNDVARMLRNGLAVVGFAALEDFIKARTSEVLSEVGSTNIPFRDLPEKLRFATTFEAIGALSYQLSIREKADRVLYVQEHALKIASTANTAYELTPHAFGYDQANVSDETVKSILKSFHIDDPWGEMTKLAARIGLVALPLGETFKGAGTRRNRAAHVAHADTPITDLVQFTKEAYAIAIGFDALLSKALSWMTQQNSKYLKGLQKISSTSISLRFIKLDDTTWRELLEGKSRAVRTGTDLNVLLPLSRTRAQAAENLLVIVGKGGEIHGWECY